jgi:hypothetical protein
MIFKKISLIICSIALLFIVSSCGSIVKNMAISRITVENKAIPPDFGKNDETNYCV